MAMESAHQLALRRKRHLPDTGQSAIEHLRLQAGFSRGHQQGAFRRISFNDPAAVLLVNGGIVRAIRHGERPFELGAEWTIDWSAAFALDGADRRVSRA